MFSGHLQRPQTRRPPSRPKERRPEPANSLHTVMPPSFPEQELVAELAAPAVSVLAREEPRGASQWPACSLALAARALEAGLAPSPGL